jgi:hypothetical protein
MNTNASLAKRYSEGLIWAGLVSVALIGGGVAAIFVRPPNSN